MNDTPLAPPQPCLGCVCGYVLELSCPAEGTIDPEPRRTQITALARQSWSLHVLSRDCLFLLLTSGIRLGCFANSRVICPACSQQVLCVPVMFPKLSPGPSHCSRGLFQARKERSHQAPTAHVLHLPALPPPQPLPLSGAQCLFVTSLTHSENSFLRKDLINSFILRRKWLVMLIGLSSPALLSFGVSCGERWIPGFCGRRTLLVPIFSHIKMLGLSSVVLAW